MVEEMAKLFSTNRRIPYRRTRLIEVVLSVVIFFWDTKPAMCVVVGTELFNLDTFQYVNIALDPRKKDRWNERTLTNSQCENLSIENHDFQNPRTLRYSLRSWAAKSTVPSVWEASCDRRSRFEAHDIIRKMNLLGVIHEN